MRRAVITALLGLTICAQADAAAPKLQRCGGAWCGSIQRPLGNGRTIDVAFRWYKPARPSGPPLVAVEGGPGYPSTGSRWEYRGIFGPLIRTRGLLLVDQRGTGGSALIDC